MAGDAELSGDEHERKRDRQMIELLNELRIALPGFLAIAIGAAFLLITDLLFDGARVWIYSVIVWAVIVGLWFGRPLYRTARD